MKKSEEISVELMNISPTLSQIEKVNVFAVPEGYFDGLEEKIATTVFLQQEKKEPFQKVPDGYFDSLSSRILSKIKEEEESAEAEIKAISPALHYLKEEHVFDLPDGYFDSLSDRILGRIKNENGKVVVLNSARKWWRYAAAAVIAGIITIFSFQFIDFKSGDNKTNSIASTEMPAYMQLASHYKTTKEINQGIESLSDDEIARYLEKNTSLLDDEDLIKNTDTKELPTPDDYLIDDNALSNYLQKINVESKN
jgi:hypothetical protein